MERESAFDLLQLFGQEQLNDIQLRLSRITRLGFVTANYQGEPLTKYTGFCDFCSHFRQNKELSKNCVASDAMSSIQAAIMKKPLLRLPLRSHGEKCGRDCLYAGLSRAGISFQSV